MKCWAKALGGRLCRQPNGEFWQVALYFYCITDALSSIVGQQTHVTMKLVGELLVTPSFDAS